MANAMIPGDDIFAPKLIKNVLTSDSVKVSCNMFKSESLYTADRKAPFSAYIKGCVEPEGGGHYYARSFNNNKYQSASCTIPLSKCSVDTKGTRNAYISLGICTEGSSRYSFFDVGLRNNGNGWFPAVWGLNFLTDWSETGPTPDKPNIIHRNDAEVPICVAIRDYNSPVLIPNTATVSVLIEVGRTSSVDWMRTTFSHSGKTGKIAINVPRGKLFPESSAANPMVRFNRFMSLVPKKSGDDHRDGSRLEGWMENLKIGSSRWTAANLQHVWDVQDENVPTIQISTLADSGGASNRDHAVIYHSHAVYPG
jgi:hypothetical protein